MVIELAVALDETGLTPEDEDTGGMTADTEDLGGVEAEYPG
jgi:hypothetical protein